MISQYYRNKREDKSFNLVIEFFYRWQRYIKKMKYNGSFIWEPEYKVLLGILPKIKIKKPLKRFLEALNEIC